MAGNTSETNVSGTKPKGGSIADFFNRMGVLGELMAFFWKRKQFWLIPLMAALLVFAVIIVLGSTGPGGVFIYTLF